MLSLGFGSGAQEIPAEFMSAPEGIACDPMLAKTPSVMNDPNGRLLRLMAAHEHARRSASRVNFEARLFSHAATLGPWLTLDRYREEGR